MSKHDRRLVRERDEALEAEATIRRILMMPGFERDRLLADCLDALRGTVALFPEGSPLRCSVDALIDRIEGS